MEVRSRFACFCLFFLLVYLFATTARDQTQNYKNISVCNGRMNKRLTICYHFYIFLVLFRYIISDIMRHYMRLCRPLSIQNHNKFQHLYMQLRKNSDFRLGSILQHNTQKTMDGVLLQTPPFIAFIFHRYTYLLNERIKCFLNLSQVLPAIYN